MIAREESLMATDREAGRLFLHLKAAQATMRAALTDAVSELGVTMPQLLMLRALDLSPGISGAQLARECFVSPQAMVSNLARLCEAGLIERTKGAGRTFETHLTGKGHAILDRAGSRVLSVERYVTQEIGAERLRELDELLVTLNGVFEKSLVTITTRAWDDD
jgi:DNA-binding MarR family transcriptional regulator